MLQECSRFEKKKNNTVELYAWLLLARINDKLKHTKRLFFKRENLIEICISILESGHYPLYCIVKLKLVAGKINITITQHLNNCTYTVK